MKRNKILSVFLTVCLLMSFVPAAEAWILSYGHIAGDYMDTDGGSGDGWSFNYGEDEISTLTLSGVNISDLGMTGIGYNEIYYIYSLEIVLEEGTVNTVSASPDPASIYENYVIYVDGDLTITGGGTLNVTGETARDVISGIYATGDIIIDGSTVIVSSGDSDQSSVGIHAGGSVTIRNSTVTATAGAAQASLGIEAAGGVIVEGDAVEMTLNCDPNASSAGACGVVTNNGATPLYFTGAQVGGAPLESIDAGQSTAGNVLASGSGPVGISFTPPPAEPETPSDDDDPMRGNVYGQYVSDTSIDVISVDIEWGSMRFAYSAEAVQIWIPEEHDYSGEPATGWTPLDKNGDLLTITNHSNVDVEITVSTQTTNAGVTGIDFEKVDAGIADYAGDYVLQAGVENEYENADYLMLAVEPVGSLQSSETDIDTIAEITVTIEKYEAP